MPQSQRLHLLVYRITHVMLSVAFFLMLGLAWLYPVALAADRTRPQIDPQLQRHWTFHWNGWSDRNGHLPPP